MIFDLEGFLGRLTNLPQPTHYKDWFDVYDAMTVHTQGRSTELLKRRRPGEPTDVMDYRIAVMKPISKGQIGKGMDNLSLIFQNTAYSLSLSKQLTEFIIDARFSDNQDFKAYCETKTLRVGIEDPNGLLVWLPKIEEDGQMSMINPRMYNSRKIRYRADDAIMVVDQDVESASHELKTNFRVGGKYNETSDRYLLITVSGYYYLYPPKRKAGAWSVEAIFEREYEQIPAIILGGNITSNGYYESFFQGFVPFGDEALCTFSDHQAVNVQFSYPIREEKGIECDYRGCKGGYMDAAGEIKCPSCNGTGYRSTRTPYGVYVTPPRDFTDIDSKDKPIPAVQFYSPDTGILDYSSKEWEVMLKHAGEAIHLVHIDEAQSGVAKNIDQQGKFAMTKKCGDNYYDNLIYNSLWILEQTINTNPIKPSVYKPAKYQIDYTHDALDEIFRMISGGTPKHLIAIAIEEFLQKSYDEGNPVHKMTAVLIEYDQWFCYTPQEKERLLAQGIITKEDYAKSAYAYVKLRLMARKYGDEFVNRTNEDIIKELDKEFQAYIKLNTPTEREEVTPSGEPINEPGY